MSQPRITTSEPTFATGYWDDLFIGVWRGAVTIAAAQEWGRQYQHMAARHPNGFLSLGIVEAGTPIPDGPARQALSAAMDLVGPGIRAMAGVQEANGFAGAAIRSVLLALSNMSSGSYRRRMFGSCSEAAGWLAPHFETRVTPVSPSEIMAAAEAFRRMIDPRRAMLPRESRMVS